MSLYRETKIIIVATKGLGRECRGACDCLIGTEFLFGMLKKFWKQWGGWHDTMNVLNAFELHT